MRGKIKQWNRKQRNWICDLKPANKENSKASLKSIKHTMKKYYSCTNPENCRRMQQSKTCFMKKALPWNQDIRNKTTNIHHEFMSKNPQQNISKLNLTVIFIPRMQSWYSISSPYTNFVHKQHNCVCRKSKGITNY